ncbi:MFS transporter [Actinokineospora auranticolor]|uniref:Sugar phosphate permease n=1 Tax=Actinokineospora auranticolor TaxID=155976 RepID=A0A2S6GQH0_9PSEU|nr:MFS transporter [Actinokineospora auranticolor]PPK67440.1 sugar phosphate permease [Actinokineospora auranticolor]
MPGTRRAAVLVWATAVFVYVLALFHRSSLGVAGLQAADRFEINAAALGTFTVLQIGVYAAMQIPTGLLVDRFGPRRTLTAAALFMGLGQLLFAVASNYPLALVARGVLGVGDAMTFVSVLRLVAAYYPPRRYVTLTSATAALGAVGNLAATVPLTLLLDHAGWTATFAIAGAATVAYALVVTLRVRDTPDEQARPARPRTSPREVLDQVRQAWRVPGTRLGFWAHFSTVFAPGVLGLLWGYPYLVQAQGFSPAEAGSVLSLLVLVAMVANPVIGEVTGRWPATRVPIVAGYLLVELVLLGLLLGWPGGVVPGPLVVVAFGLLAVGGPASGVAFAVARDYNPLHRVGTATGVVNVGGFSAVTISALGIGLLLGGDTAAADAAAFRTAFLALVVILLLGGWRTLVWWRRVRAGLLAAHARGDEVPVRVRRTRWDLPERAAS